MGIETTAQLRSALQKGRRLSGMRLQSLDLTDVEEEMLDRDPLGAIVLGGTLTPRLERQLRSGAPWSFPPRRTARSTRTAPRSPAAAPAPWRPRTWGHACTPRTSDVLDDALERLAAVPTFTPDVAAWAREALEVIADHPAAHTVASIGIPTWFSGHEPPNVFAGKIRSSSRTRCGTTSSSSS